MAKTRIAQKEQTRRELFELALDEIRKRGLAEASIDDIARRAGVSRGTFYFHFPSKEQVVAELLQASKLGLARALDELPERAPLEAVLERVCTAMTGEWQGEPRLYLEAGLHGLRQAGNGEAREDDPARSALSKRFRAAARELKSPLSPEVLADVCLLDLLAAGMAWAGDPSLDLLSTLQAVALLFLDGVRSRR